VVLCLLLQASSACFYRWRVGARLVCKLPRPVLKPAEVCESIRLCNKMAEVKYGDMGILLGALVMQARICSAGKTYIALVYTRPDILENQPATIRFVSRLCV
jgi:hypothetical protein